MGAVLGTWSPGSVSIFPLVDGIGETERDVRGSWDSKIVVSGLKERGTRKIERKCLLHLETKATTFEL